MLKGARLATAGEGEVCLACGIDAGVLTRAAQSRRRMSKITLHSGQCGQIYMPAFWCSGDAACGRLASGIAQLGSHIRRLALFRLAFTRSQFLYLVTRHASVVGGAVAVQAIGGAEMRCTTRNVRDIQ